MVSRSYLLHKPPPPSAAKMVIDQRLVPILIDAAGAVEALCERMAIRTKAAPRTSVGVAFGLGALLSLLFLRPRR